MDLVTAFIVLLVILLPILRGLFQRSRLPPSPSFGLPLIGHLHLLGRMPHQSLQALAKKHGSILFLRLGIIPAVVVSSVDLAKEVLKNQDLTFASRPYFLVGEDVGYHFMGMSLAGYGDHWKKLRRLYTLELFTAKRIDSFLSLRLEELSHMLSAVLYAHEKNQAVNMRNLLTCFTFNTITRILMNKRYFQHQGEELQGIDSSEASVFKAVLSEITEISLQFHISEFVPAYLRWMDLSVYHMRRLHADQDKFLQKIVDEHKYEKNKSSKKDFMDLMLELLDGDPKGDNMIKAAMTELVSAGTETSATTVEWTFGEILHRAPHVLTKAHEELDSVVGRSRLVDEADLPRLPYLQAIIKEAFRLHVPVPLLVPHMSMHEASLDGYHVPKGATTIVNAYAIGRDPALWDKPLEFRPERFLGSSVDVKGQDFELLPFGSGRRACPGMGLGLKTVQLALANLIHGFDWKASGQNALEEAAGAVIWLKTPLEAVGSPRLQVEVLTSCHI